VSAIDIFYQGLLNNLRRDYSVVIKGWGNL
jgi:hypothetical protein